VASLQLCEETEKGLKGLDLKVEQKVSFMKK
jgi:hypothetical protein